MSRSQVGIIADGGGGKFQRLVGLVLSEEGSELVLAIPLGALPEELQLPTLVLEAREGEAEGLAVNLVRVPASETIDSIVGWETCPRVDPKFCRQLKGKFYSSDTEGKNLSTDSMMTASSRKMAPTGRTTFAKGGSDGDDELDPQSKMMDAFSNQMASLYGANQPGAGSSADRLGSLHSKPIFQPHSNLPPSNLPPSLGTQMPAWMEPEEADVSDYERLTRRFGGPAKAGTHGSSGYGKPTPAPDFQQLDPQTQMMMMMMSMMQQQNKKSGVEEEKGGKAFRRIRSMKARTEDQPEKIVSQFLEEAMDKLGVEDGDAWQLWQMSEKINWGNMSGLHRCHFHIAHALTLSLKGKKTQCEAYLVQMLRALHQVALDGGTWGTASLLLPRADPIYREQFGATGEELEAIVAYQEAMKKIRSKPETAGDDKKEKSVAKDSKSGKGEGK